MRSSTALACGFLIVVGLRATEYDFSNSEKSALNSDPLSQTTLVDNDSTSFVEKVGCACGTSTRTFLPSFSRSANNLRSPERPQKEAYCGLSGVIRQINFSPKLPTKRIGIETRKPPSKDQCNGGTIPYSQWTRAATPTVNREIVYSWFEDPMGMFRLFYSTMYMIAESWYEVIPQLISHLLQISTDFIPVQQRIPALR